MADSDAPTDPSSSSITHSRVRTRPISPSDPASSSRLHPHDRDSQPHRVPAKRARKAINCEPCRNSKLKCDRNRPCSSCVLRGTSHLCYQNQDVSSARLSNVDSAPRPLDATFEFSKIRHSLALLESHYVAQQRAAASGTTTSSSGFPSRTSFDFTAPAGVALNGTLHSHAPPKQESIDSDRDLLDVHRRDSTDAYYRRASVDQTSYRDPGPSGGASESAPGARGRSGQGGFYAGPTSAVSHLSSDARDAEPDPDQEPDSDTDRPDRTAQPTPSSSTLYSPLPHAAGPSASPIDPYDSDRDLLSLLPDASIIDGLLDYYFEYCTWIYRHVHRGAFAERWTRYKRGRGAERLVLGTACLCMAVALHYLPDDHDLFGSLGLGIGGVDDGDHESSLRRAKERERAREELGVCWYNVMRVALQRRQAESRAHTLELVELQLVRTHYLTLSKIDSEEIWAVKSELMGVGTAMGLHRDPDCGGGGRVQGHGHGGMSEEMKERRRWAWWHVILLERWQAFMFGRPLAIATHHFDTALPSAHVRSTAPPDAIPQYTSNLALFRLAHLLGDIMDTAISLQPVAYDTVISHDRRLQAWWDALPSVFIMDEWELTHALRSAGVEERRRGVQSVVLRTAFLHIRFTLHRPWAGREEAYAPAAGRHTDARVKQSWDTAVHAASELVALVAQARPEMHSSAALGVPGHMNWGPVHVFSAAMFFCFQLVRAPAQPGAALLRQNVVSAVAVLERAGVGGLPVAAKALAVLRALGPLYAEGFADADEAERERMKTAVLSVVRQLAFPYHDSPNVPLGRGRESATLSERGSEGSVVSGGSGGVGSPALDSVSPESPVHMRAPGLHSHAAAAGYPAQQQQQQPFHPHTTPGSSIPGGTSAVLSMHSKTLPSLRWAPVQTSAATQPQPPPPPPSNHSVHPHVHQQQQQPHRPPSQDTAYAQAISPVTYAPENTPQAAMPPPPPQQQQQQQAMDGMVWSQPRPQQQPQQVQAYQHAAGMPPYVDGGMAGYAGAGMGMGMSAEESMFWGTNVGQGFGQGEWGSIFQETPPAPEAYSRTNGRGSMMMEG